MQVKMSKIKFPVKISQGAKNSGVTTIIEDN
jgi:hypothetical protein